MFRIITTNGVELGFTETVRYIKRNPNQCFVACDKKDAIGVAYNSTPYNLLGHNEIEEAETVIVSEFDGGAELARVKALNDTLTSQLAETDEAIIEIYERMEESNNG